MDTSFEVYVRNKGDSRWVLDSRYGPLEKDSAVNDAKRLERQSSIEAVRVVRETHYSDTNVTQESVVYATPLGDKKKEDGGRAADGSPMGKTDIFDIDDDDEEDDDVSNRKGIIGGLFGGRSRDVDDPYDDDDNDGDGDDLVAPTPVIPSPANIVANVPPRLRGGASTTVLKLLVILVVSAGFASIVTLVYASYFYPRIF